MSTYKEIAKYIETGNVVLALQSVKNTIKPAQERNDNSYKLLKEVYSLCYKNNKANIKLSSKDADVLFELTTTLCLSVAHSWKCNRMTFMQCLYHINNYLIKHNLLHARKVSEFFFQLKASSWDGSWDTNESLIAANLVYDFISQIADRFLEILASDGENSLSSWLSFIFRLFELNDFKKLFKLFTVLESIWVKAYHQCNDKLRECIRQCLTEMGKWANRLTLSDTKVETTDRDISCLFNLIDRMIILSSLDDVSTLTETLEFWAVAFKKLLPNCSEDMTILVNCSKLFNNIKNPSVVVDYFDKTFSSVMERTSKKSVAFHVLVVFLIKFRPSFLSCSTLIESRASSIAQLFSELMQFSQKNTDAPPRRAKILMDLVYCALSIIASPTVQKDCLVSVFPLVKTFVKQFIKAIPDTDNKTNISVGIAAILNVVLAFKKVELFEEPAWLCRYVLLIFLKIEPEVLWGDYYYKSYVETWLSNTVIAYSKCNNGVEAQVMMIVFAAYQPKYTMAAMRKCASLKCSKVQTISIDATVLDVLNGNKDEIEKQFPELRLADVNLDLLLLGEIYGYTKLRELHGDLVLMVYKTAAKTVKDYITLANILCCTVEAFSLGTGDTDHISKLDVSLNNMIKHLQKMESNGKDCEHDLSVVLCTIGNLYYQQARLEIQRIRQKSEAEVAQNEKYRSKKKIPIFQAGEKDDLDVTEVDLVGTSCKLSQKSGVFSLLTNALNYWNMGEQSLQVAPDLVLGPTLSFMKGAGYISRLHRYKELETTCWTLLFKIATKFDSLKYKVLGAAELLFSCRSVESSILDEIDVIMDTPKKFDRKCYVYHLYSINRARNFLLCGKIDESRQALEKIDGQAVLPFFLVNAQLKILRSFLDLELQKDETPLLPIVKLFENFLYLILNNQWETFNESCVVQCLMIDICTLLGTLYSDLKCVRRARLYTKSELTLVQRLGLPVRVCELMTLKCWVDLLTWNVTDSDLNAQEVENMLELGVLTSGAPSRLNPSQQSAIKCVPHFLSTKNCKCSHCTDVDYPSLALNAIINRILILIGNSGRTEAQNVINVGHKVVEIVKQNDQACNSLWTPFSSSVARFYYVVARTNILWKRYKAGVHYATLACKMLEAEPVKNHGLISSSKQQILESRFAQNYSEPARKIPVSKRFAVGLEDSSTHTPEPQKYTDTKPWESTVHNPKAAPEGYLTHRKSIFNKKLNFFDIDTPENEKGKEIDSNASRELTPVSNDDVKTDDRKRHPKKHEVPTITVLDTSKFVGVKCLGDVEDEDERKLQLGIAALKLNGGDESTPVVKRTARKAAMFSSTRKPQTERKAKLQNLNLFNAASIGSLNKMVSTTPAIKVFYDPEGMAHSACTVKRNKPEKVGLKRTTRLAALSKAMKDEKCGTPTASKAVRTTKGKLMFDEDSDDELELITAPRKYQNTKKNGVGQKCILDCVKTESASTANEKSRKNATPGTEYSAKSECIVINDLDDQEPASVPSRKMFGVQKSGKEVTSKQFIDDSKEISHKSKSEIVSKPVLVTSVESNFDELKQDLAVPLDADRKVYSRRICDKNTLSEQSIPTQQVKAKKKMPAISKPLPVATEFDSDESRDEGEPIVAPFRKLLTKDGNEKVCPSRRLIHDETTITNQSLKLENEEDDMEPIAAPFRKLLTKDGREKVGPSRRLIHDETTIIDQSLKLEKHEDDMEPIAAPFRKFLNEDGQERIGPSRRLIHDETTISDNTLNQSPKKVPDSKENEKPRSMRRVIHDDSTLGDDSQSPDLIESSVVEVTPPKNGRRCVPLTPLAIDNQMRKLTLATRSTRKRVSPATVPESTPTRKDACNGTTSTANNTTKEPSNSLAKTGNSRPLRAARKLPK